MFTISCNETEREKASVGVVSVFRTGGVWRGARLQQGRDGAEGVPEHGGQVWHRLALLAQLQQSVFSRLRAGQLIDPLVDLLSVHLGQGCDVGYSLYKAGAKNLNPSSAFSPSSTSTHPPPSHQLHRFQSKVFFTSFASIFAGRFTEFAQMKEQQSLLK